MKNINYILDELKLKGNYRSLKNTSTSSKYISYNGNNYLNFSSNDYLGLSDTKIQKQFFSELSLENHFVMSNPSSRLMSGNSADYLELETTLSTIFDAESALVLSSGFMINAGVLPAITTSKDIIIADKHVHASIIEGMKLSSATTIRYAHNSMEHLEMFLKKYSNISGDIWVVTESIFSMDGDIAPVKEIMALKSLYNFKLYIDEAHAFGVRGETGCGIIEELGIASSEVDIIVATLGKAAASQGGFVICSSIYRELLINKMRTLIFSTALPPINLMWSNFIIKKISTMADRRVHLAQLIEVFKSELNLDNLESHIIPIIIGDNFKCLELSEHLSEKGYLTSAIRHPTVAEGTARIRVSLNALMTDSDIINFIKDLKLCR